MRFLDLLPGSQMPQVTGDLLCCSTKTGDGVGDDEVNLARAKSSS